MERKLCGVWLLSLKEISLRRSAVNMWSQHDILATIDSSNLEDVVKDNISKLALPLQLKGKMKCLVTPVGAELYNWKCFHENYLNTAGESFDINILGQLYWTSLATVDYKKTAERLIRCKQLDIVKCYKLACLYCLDACIPDLWNNLSEEDKRYFYEEDGTLHITTPKLEFCWAYMMKGEDFILDFMFETEFGNKTFNQNAFEYLALVGNKSATEYFFRKLTYDEKETSLLRTAQSIIDHQLESFIGGTFPQEKRCDTLCYLLSLMSHEQIMVIFKQYSFNLLVCLLDWPWQDIFMDIAEHVWTYLTPFNYIALLEIISGRIKLDYYLTNLFQKFFLHGPGEFRKYFFNQECVFSSVLKNIFVAENTEVIKVIFMNVDSANKKRVFNSNVFKLFYGSILRGKWHLVELCLQEAGLSDEDKGELKEDFLRFLTKMDPRNTNGIDYIAEKFLQLF